MLAANKIAYHVDTSFIIYTVTCALSDHRCKKKAANWYNPWAICNPSGFVDIFFKFQHKQNGMLINFGEWIYKKYVNCTNNYDIGTICKIEKF